MTTIMEEVLRPFQSDDKITRLAQAKRLENQLNSFVETSPEWAFFVYLVNRYCGKYVFPEDILTLCHSLNIYTIEDLLLWIKSVNGSILMPILEPKLNIALGTKKEVIEIRRMIEGVCVCENPCKWNFGDTSYYLITEDDLGKVLAKCPIDKEKYITDTFDCEDFARTTKCWCALHGIGNVAFGNVEVNFYASGNLLFTHGVNLIPLADGQIVCVEPKSDIIWPADQPEFGFGADEMRLRFIQF